jgi:hypothetical protein
MDRQGRSRSLMQFVCKRLWSMETVSNLPRSLGEITPQNTSRPAVVEAAGFVAAGVGGWVLPVGELEFDHVFE